MTELRLGSRLVGAGHEPLVVAEIGINHDGDVGKALRMIDDAAATGCECVKFQCHVVDDEMVPNDVVPANADESIWDIMSRCALSEAEEREVKAYAESRGLIYLCTPFSRAAALRLEKMRLTAFKIGSGECNNYPLVSLIASFGQPVILSTGMNSLQSVRVSVDILRGAGVPYAIMQCTSMYPTPYERVHLGGLRDLGEAFPEAVLGLSDHSLGPYTCLAAVALGARILEKHFTSDVSWPGPDVPISLDPSGLGELVVGARAVYLALGGHKEVLAEEQPTIDFAYASVVTTTAINAGDAFSEENLWVKRPGTGEIAAADYAAVLGRAAVRGLPPDHQLGWEDVGERPGRSQE